MDFGWLTNNGTNTASSDDGPDEKRDTGSRNKIGLDGEQVANLMDGEPDGREGNEPEDEKGGVVGRCCPCIFGKGVVDGFAILRSSVFARQRYQL